MSIPRSNAVSAKRSGAELTALVLLESMFARDAMESTWSRFAARRNVDWIMPIFSAAATDM